MKNISSFTVDVEDWFHILDSEQAPPLDQWDQQESRVAPCVERLLSLLEANAIKATFFWLGWVAERHPELVVRCQQAGHETASHGYAHVLAYQVGPLRFFKDISLGKQVLENIIGEQVLGFRAAGFGITNDTQWAYEEIVKAGYQYDSSIFPSNRGHGGVVGGLLGPHTIETPSGPLPEIPMSLVEVAGKRLSLFGGGYLRLAPLGLIHWGIRRLHRNDVPLIIYIHPREIDPDQPQLPLSIKRRFKTYVNLKSTYPKLKSLCQNYHFLRMRDLLPLCSQHLGYQE